MEPASHGESVPYANRTWAGTRAGALAARILRQQAILEAGKGRIRRAGRVDGVDGGQRVGEGGAGMSRCGAGGAARGTWKVRR